MDHQHKQQSLLSTKITITNLTHRYFHSTDIENVSLKLVHLTSVNFVYYHGYVIYWFKHSQQFIHLSSWDWVPSEDATLGPTPRGSGYRVVRAFPPQDEDASLNLNMVTRCEVTGDTQHPVHFVPCGTAGEVKWGLTSLLTLSHLYMHVLHACVRACICPMHECVHASVRVCLY